MQEYNVIGLMSGTSLDGVDLAFCHFIKEDAGWKFEIRNADTIHYQNEWREKLSTLHTRDAATFAGTNAAYGNFLGTLVKEFIEKNKITADFVSSHGHTIFHQPQNKFTSQIGDGAAISAACGLPVVCDFRSGDVALGGQGAPLVPIGDQLLFPEYDFCLNLGGIANISFQHSGERVAFDVSPCNIILNHLAMQKGKPFDENGMLARGGKVNEPLLNQLNNLPFYKKHFPKSLGREDVERDFLSLIDSSPASTEDKLRTFCEHVALQVSKAVNGNNRQSTVGSSQTANNNRMLVTGGGTYNLFLVERMKDLCSAQMIIPEEKIIQYKEALIFAFLGVLRWRGEVNCLKSVTGASRDSVGGAVFSHRKKPES
ncbi:MAG: anhydro-N-acetylmuramic acid kinase [Bacteroidetes bacterium]|nr:anhydro-N-acetylmuramic acid kinase [Bacteroidota bacterium]